MNRRALPGLLLVFAGALFALGLAVSGMTQPAKVIGFLDVLGTWDPSLAFVMLGAVVVYTLAYRMLAVKLPKPLFAPRFSLPTATALDAPLLVGAAVFGVGWGMGGLCPGPALVAFGAVAAPTLWFVPAIVLGMLAHQAARAALDP